MFMEGGLLSHFGKRYLDRLSLVDFCISRYLYDLDTDISCMNRRLVGI